MGLFDRFRRRVREAAADAEVSEISTDEGSEDAKEAVRLGQEMRRKTEIKLPINQPSPIPLADEEWDDWDDEEISPPRQLTRKEKRRLAKEIKKPLESSEIIPEGSAIHLRVQRSTTGRKLVDVSSSPRGSTIQREFLSESGSTMEVDLGGGIVESGGRIIKNGKALDELLEEIETILLEADMSQRATEALTDLIRSELIGRRLRKGADLSRVIEASVIRSLRSLLTSSSWDFFSTVDSLLAEGDTPVSIMLVGVNGTGKTTTTAKIAHALKSQGKRVVLAAGDTFRAGAIDQLQSHADRLDIRCVSSQRGGDPAAIARDAIEHARARRMDVVLIDTAGRMQNKSNLMEELRKVHRVSSPHLVLFVGDALAGNDAVEQAVEFQRMLAFDGCVLSKLDTDAKGGASLSIAHATGRPIVLIGTGQEYDDLKVFDADWILNQIFDSD